MAWLWLIPIAFIGIPFAYAVVFVLALAWRTMIEDISDLLRRDR